MASTIISKVKTIWAIGRNYGAHAKEMGAESPKAPVVFLKSPATLVEGSSFQLPKNLGSIHHELELAVRLGDQLKPTHVALALDLTARDKQAELKEARLPWALAKSFNQSCPISGFVDYGGDAWFKDLSFELAVNDTIRQYGKATDMIFDLQQVLSYLKEHFPVQEGDLILTGTPEGVGPLQPGDKLYAEAQGKIKMNWTVN